MITSNMFHFPRRIPLPFTDSYVLFTPPWDDYSGWAHTDAWFLIALVPVGLVLWLYRYELKLVSRSAATGLLGLRLVLLGVLLILLGLAPIWGRTIKEEVPGRVVIAVDDSESMGVADPQRPPAEKLKLALALQQARDLCSDNQMKAWIKDYEMTGAPSFSPGNEKDQTAHDQVIRRIDELTRRDMARLVLDGEAVKLLENLSGKHSVELLGFARETWDVPLNQVGVAFPNRNDKKADQNPAEQSAAQTAGRDGTNLMVPLARALEKTGPDSSGVLGVILLTDGQHNDHQPPAAKASELGERGLPIYPIGLGSQLPPPDIALQSVKAPTTAFKDADVTVEARIRVTGLAEQDLIAELRRPGQDQPLERRAFHHDGRQTSYIQRFTLTLDKPGTQTFSVHVKPALADTKEVRTDNNSQAIKINVADDRARVLLIDGEARWEFHYLASALSRDRSMQVTSVVFQQPRLGRVPEEELRKTGNPGLVLPSESDALANFDCIVLGDVTPEQLTPADRQRLLRYVADRGGALVMVAGKRAMPLGYASAEDPIQKLLPISQPHVAGARPDLGFPLSLTHEGTAADFMKMERDPAKSAERWTLLPRHYWGIVGTVKPGASALAYWDDDKPDKDTPGQKENRNGLIVRQSYGFGRVLFVGLDSTWRWRYRTGDTYHHRFWGQVIRWAATDKPLVTGNDWVRFGTREPVYSQGQEVEIVARLGEETPALKADAVSGARLLKQVPGQPEEAVALVPLKPREAQPRLLEGRIRDLPAGEYQIELAIPELQEKLNAPAGQDGKVKPLRASLTINPAISEEMADVSSNWPLLEDLAAQSGGRFFTADQTGDLLELLKKRMSTREVHLETRLWQWWGTLVGLFLLLTIEWVARKVAGLP